MNSLVYNGPPIVSVTDVEDARIERPIGVVVPIARTKTCGSDLHMHEGRTDMEPGRVVGHERDGVGVRFNVICGQCKTCERGLTDYCITTQPKDGFSRQARCRTTRPRGPASGQGLRCHGHDGCAGLMAALSATFKEASMIVIVDRHPDRLRRAAEIGCIPIDDAQAPPVVPVLELTRGEGTECGCECVGDRAHHPESHEHPNAMPANLVKAVGFTGSRGVGGVIVPKDPGPPDDLARHGHVPFD